jgi:hypothetical protein
MVADDSLDLPISSFLMGHEFNAACTYGCPPNNAGFSFLGWW